jgi:glutamyl-tRNA synthetase
MSQTRPVVTRFAPSPTGFLHIGGARTALFNWLFAKRHGGVMRLRIEDTDRARSTQEAIAAILEGLAWLGLDWDGAPVYQHQRLDRHAEIAYRLLESGNAYRCYCSPAELETMRERARQEGRAVAYDGTWRDRDPAEAPPGVQPVIRFRSPMSGETVIEDRVQGRVVIANTQLDDLIILRSDATPTYNLSVVVDDHDMDVTHVIRGDDHLTNAARQSQIFEALGWAVPEFAHIPLIHGPDGAKLSKRHGALGVDAYRAMGYLPQAMRNYLVRLGWSHGDDEIMSMEQMIEWFGLDAIGRAPARFDFDRLDSLNGHYMRLSADEALLEPLLALWAHSEEYAALLAALTPQRKAQLSLAISSLKGRSKTLVELSEGARFLFAERPLGLDDKAAALIDDEARDILRLLLADLEALGTWSGPALEEAVRSFVERHGLKLGSVAQPLRAALTGITRSPGIFEVLEILGRSEATARISDQVAAPA